MSKLNVLSLLLIGVSFFTFVGAYYYHQQSGRHDLGYATAIVGVTSALSPSENNVEPILSSSRYVITEDRSILITMLASVVLLALAIACVVISKVEHGKGDFDVQIIFASLLISVWILYTINDTGLWDHV